MLRKRTFLFAVIFCFSVFYFAGCKDGANEKSLTKSDDTIAAKKTAINGNNAVNENSAAAEMKSGLLLGLSTSKDKSEYQEGISKRDEFRTLWIFSNGDGIVQKEKKGSIITPYEDKFYEVSNDSFKLSEEQEPEKTKEEEIYERYSSLYSYNSIVSNILGEKKSALYTEKSFTDKYKINEEGAWGYQFYTEWPLYIGNKYICIMNDYYETGGGTYKGGHNDIKMLDISGLGKIETREKTKKLYDFLEGDVKESLVKYVKDNNSKFGNKPDDNTLTNVKRKFDLDNLALARNNGKWIIQIPLYEAYVHEGNGSNFYSAVDFVNFECKLPGTLISHDNLCVAWKKIKEKIPGAKDAVSSPEEDLLAVLTTNELLIFAEPEVNLDKPSLRINVDKGTTIVSVQWATGNYVKQWDKQLGGYLK